MYTLFELNKIISVAKPGGDSGVSIEHSAYFESGVTSTLVLVCNNGYVLFRYFCESNNQPLIRQLSWFHNPGKKIKALCFDPSGNWLLIVTADASIYVLPVLSLLEPKTKIHHFWKLDDVTEIKLNGQRASLTSVRWWQTLQGQQIAVIGSELGEISFINLLNKKEVGGTYITVGISALDILHDESHDTTYLLITGSNRQQWRLLLEEKKSEFYWPFNSEIELITCDGNKNASLDEKNMEQRPHRLSKFESGTFLTPQSGGGQNLVSAYNSTSSLLQVLEGDLEQMHLFSYQVPPNCENIILSDRLIFITQTLPSCDKEEYILRILSRKFAEVSAENSKKREQHDAEVQNFVLDSKILAIYKKVLFADSIQKCFHTTEEKLVSDVTNLASSDSHSDYKVNSHKIDTTATHTSKNVTFDTKCSQNSFSSQKELGVQMKHQASSITSKGDLDGCLIVQEDAVWECRPRISPEKLFLSLTAVPADLPWAEKLGVMLGLDIHRLYEVAADLQLADGQFAQAVHLYQLSKCPQLKRVAHFMSYGYLSELIAYIQVLFSTKGVEIVPADKGHFANIALHCFAQQVMEKILERQAITLAFKKFLRDNMYYDEEVAVRLLAEQGLYDLLHYFAKVRGQHGLMVETLLAADGVRDSVDHLTHDALVNAGYENVLLHSVNEDYIRCMTSYHLLQFLAGKPSLLSQHLQHLIALLPKMNVFLLNRVASLYDPSRCTAKLALKNIAAAKHHHRYWSIGSLASVSSDVLDFIHNDEESTNEEDVIKFFIFVLLMLNHKRSNRKFDRMLLSCEVPNTTSQIHSAAEKENNEELSHPPHVPLACGLAHVAFISNGNLYTWGKAGSGRLGHGDIVTEYQNPHPLTALIRLQVKVLAVSCGALHTLALTDCGVFGWGSSRYGQLGAGEVQRACQPIIIESLLKECIVAVQCGQYHSLALTKDGRVYTWGWGVHGQLGHGNPEDINLPKVIEFLRNKPVTALGAGQGHSIVLTRAGEVYTFGCGMFGQLGTGTIQKRSTPQYVDIPEPIMLIASGYFHVIAVSRTNKVYIWGCNPQALRLQAQSSRRARQQNMSHNQDCSTQPSYGIGTSASGKILPSRLTQPYGVLQQTHLVPNLVDSTAISVPISQVSCGSHHSAIITVDGEIYTWGRNMEGQIGNGTRREQKTPSMVLLLNDRKIIHIACGADFTVALDSAGKVWGWGQNDGGQVGPKPAPEPSSKPASGSSSGRVITIRTNRRMITITQPCRQGLLRPVEIAIPNDTEKVGELDSGSFENEYSVQNMIYYRASGGKELLEVPDFSKLDNPSYGPYALHATLKAFHHCCDSVTILNHCLSFSDFQAAAKVCTLESLYAQAIEYQLKALTADNSTTCKDCLPTALEVIDFYSRLIDPDNTEANQKFIQHVIKFWMDHKLQVQPLESYFHGHLDLFSYPLSLILFSNGISKDAEQKADQNFLGLLSTAFCLNIVATVINQIQNGKHHSELMEQMMAITGTSALLRQIHSSDALTGWDDSVPPERLWQEILHNVQKGVISHSAIHLTAGDVDLLAKSLMSERLCSKSYLSSPAKDSKVADGGKDVIVFTCGHHYTLHTFRTSVLPGFKDSMHKLPYPLPQTTKLLLAGYQLEGVIPAACPRCVLTEVKSEL